MKVLIIGGTGNISTAITRLLLARGEDVTLYNRGQTKKQISGDYKVIHGNRYDYPAFEHQMAAADYFDCVIDMIGYSPEDVKSLIRAFNGRAAHVIYCSTVDVYTKPAKKYPVTESAERQPSPLFPYAYKKALCESTLEAAAEEGAFALTIIRPAHTYNDSQSPIPFIGSGLHLLKRIRQQKPIIILGNGTSFWASAHRDDVAPIFVEAVCNESVYGEAFHVAAEEWMTWEQHFQTIADSMGLPEIEFLHIPTDMLYRMAPQAAEWSMVNFHYNNIFDNSAVKKALHYNYTISWREGVGRMLTFHDANGSIENCADNEHYNEIVKIWHEHCDKIVRAVSLKRNDGEGV